MMESSVDRESEAVTNLNMEMNSSVGAILMALWIMSLERVLRVLMM